MSSNIIKKVEKIAVIGGAAHIFNLFYNRYAVRKKLLTADTDNYYDWKGIRIFYQKTGSGSPLILLHSLHPAASSYEWSKVIDILSKDHTLYIPDLPGCGRSGKPNVLYTGFYYVQFLTDFIRDLGIEGPAVVASNESAPFALMAAYNTKNLISSCILINPPSLRSLSNGPDTVSGIKYRALNAPIIGNLIYNMLSCRMQIDMYFSEIYFYNPFHNTDDLVDTYFESSHIGNGRGRHLAACILGKYINIDPETALRKIETPVSVIEGTAVDNADIIVREWKNAKSDIKIKKIEHTKELPMLEEPEKTAEAICVLESKGQQI